MTKTKLVTRIIHIIGIPFCGLALLGHFLLVNLGMEQFDPVTTGIFVFLLIGLLYNFFRSFKAE